MRAEMFRKRWIRVLLVGIVSCVIATGSLPAAQKVSAAGSPMHVSWDDVTPAASFRNIGDWLVGMGKLSPEEAYGPFTGKQYKEGDTERFYALDFDNTTGRGKQIRA